jgi:hypothetical protein
VRKQQFVDVVWLCIGVLRHARRDRPSNWHFFVFLDCCWRVLLGAQTVIHTCCWVVCRLLRSARRDRPSSWHSVFFVGLSLAGAAWCANGNLYLLLGCVSRLLRNTDQDRPSSWHSVFFVGLLLAGDAQCANGNRYRYLLLGCVSFVTVLVRSPRQTVGHCTPPAVLRRTDQRATDGPTNDGRTGLTTDGPLCTGRAK